MVCGEMGSGTRLSTRVVDKQSARAQTSRIGSDVMSSFHETGEHVKGSKYRLRASRCSVGVLKDPCNI
jgi:hypothetical protein